MKQMELLAYFRGGNNFLFCSVSINTLHCKDRSIKLHIKAFNSGCKEVQTWSRAKGNCEPVDKEQDSQDIPGIHVP